ncbi:unnamed protein product [Parnassius apollo]|uniref:(apollo) hypothetical protein n=1 Tax=Parnassius apollo TaxID=110799 RepID=A0A8S3WKP0_PARAO|nr:unnamed protein product [Parnassius apollo]
MYKTCGNATNLAAHLKTKRHYAYLQFVNMQQKKSSESKNLIMKMKTRRQAKTPVAMYPFTSNQQIQEDSSEIKFFNQAVKRRKQVIQPTLVNYLERSISFEEAGQKHSEVTQALIYMICKDNLPLSSVEKNGLQKFVRTICPLYKLPSRKKVTHLIQNIYNTTKENLNLCAQQLSQGHTGQYIQECWKICEEFKIDKTKIVSITTDGGANIVSAGRLFLGDDHMIPCIAHCLNVSVDGVLREINVFSILCD